MVPDEKLEDLPAADKQVDFYFQKHVRLCVDGVVLFGKVEDIEIGSITRERLYRLRFEDGDLQHLAAGELQDAHTPITSGEKFAKQGD